MFYAAFALAILDLTPQDTICVLRVKDLLQLIINISVFAENMEFHACLKNWQMHSEVIHRNRNTNSA
jgi:hypothetical protein